MIATSGTAKSVKESSLGDRLFNATKFEIGAIATVVISFVGKMYAKKASAAETLPIISITVSKKCLKAE